MTFDMPIGIAQFPPRNAQNQREKDADANPKPASWTQFEIIKSFVYGRIT
jgi:hypothetical protein